MGAVAISEYSDWEVLQLLISIYGADEGGLNRLNLEQHVWAMDQAWHCTTELLEVKGERGLAAHKEFYKSYPDAMISCRKLLARIIGAE